MTTAPMHSSHRPRHDWRVVLILAVTYIFTLLVICGLIVTLAGKG